MSDLFYIGMDLCPDFTQLSYYNDITREPESVSQLNNKETYLMPNVLFYSVDTEHWYVGSEASEARFNEKGIVVDNIFEHLAANESITVADQVYSYEDLFLMMVKLHIDSFLYRYETAEVKKLVISIPEYDAELFNLLSRLYELMEVSKDTVEITSHLDSGLYYIFNQPHEIWNNSVALYDYSNDGLIYYRIDVTRNEEPQLIQVTREDYSSVMSLSKYGTDVYQMDLDFAHLAETELKKAYISAVFLTGIGFANKWMKRSTDVLCAGRRVFAGQNIYTKGACYRAVGGEYAEFYQDYFVNTKENVTNDIGITLGDEDDTFVPIIRGGSQWYNTSGNISVILDDTDRITIVYRDLVSKEERRETVRIHGLPQRPNKTTKLLLSVEFESPHAGAVVVKDLGFGKLFPTTNKIYRKEFTV